MKTIAFASDFDNTIYFGKEANPFHKEDIAAIQEFQKKGGLFGICSGRALRGIDYPSKGILNYDFKISATGSRIVGKDNALLYEDPIETALAKEIYFFLKQNTNFWVVLNTGKYLFSEHEILDGLPPNKEEDLFVSPICGVSVGCFSMEKTFGRKISGYYRLSEQELLRQGQERKLQRTRYSGNQKNTKGRHRFWKGRFLQRYSLTRRSGSLLYLPFITRTCPEQSYQSGIFHKRCIK